MSQIYESEPYLYIPLHSRHAVEFHIITATKALRKRIVLNFQLSNLQNNEQDSYRFFPLVITKEKHALAEITHATLLFNKGMYLICNVEKIKVTVHCVLLVFGS